MPRYFFDYQDGKVISDHVGTELDNVASARREAAMSLGDFVRDALQRECSLDLMVHIREQSGPVLFTAKLVYEMVDCR